MRTIDYTTFRSIVSTLNEGGIIKLNNIVDLAGAANNTVGLDDKHIICNGGKFINSGSAAITISFGNSTLEGDTNGIFDCTSGGNIKVTGSVNKRNYELKWWKFPTTQYSGTSYPEIFQGFFEDTTGYITYIINTYYVVAGTSVQFGPECTLRFSNNSRLISSSCNLIGSGTYISAQRTQIFAGSIQFTGSWRVDDVYPEWFGAKGSDGNTNNTNSISRCLSAFGKVCITDVYYFNTSLSVPAHSILEFKDGKLNNGSGNTVNLNCGEDVHILSSRPSTETFVNINLAGTYSYIGHGRKGQSITLGSDVELDGDDTIYFIEVPASASTTVVPVIYDIAQAHKTSIVLRNTGGENVILLPEKRTASGSTTISSQLGFSGMDPGTIWCIELMQVGEQVYCTRFEKLPELL